VAPGKIILASTSPRRSDLLTEAGIPFEVRPAYIEELSDSQLTARELCLINAESKALEVGTRFPAQIVLGADTVVALDNHTFGKPRDLAEARTMLESLCGRVHEVLTGVCLLHRDANKMCRFVESTRVKFRPLEEVDLDAYLASLNPLDKAGAYAAQEDNGRLIEQLEGLLSNVVGLPVERVAAALREHFP
jgi:septum formation protein